MGDEAAAGATAWLPLTERDRASGGELTLERIERLYIEQARRYHRVAALILGDQAAAEDVVQDAFARAVDQRKKFNASGALEAWLWRIVVNAALDRKRARGNDADAAHAYAQLFAPAPTGQADVDEHTREQLMRLPKRQRAAVFLRYYADLDYREIARILAVTPGGAAKLLHDAHRRLARAMRPQR
jgi:RNA polymerase sigma-70 factor (ECF subfamily)